MGGVANLPTFYRDPTEQAARDAEIVTDTIDRTNNNLTPFTDTEDDPAAYDAYLGCNNCASCAPGIGIGTFDYDPKESDWPRIERMQDSNKIGGVAGGINVNDIDTGFGFTALAGFAPADAETIPGGVLTLDVDGTGFNTVNRSDKTVPAGAWIWGVADNP